MALLLLMQCCVMSANAKKERLVVAYVISWSKEIPNPMLMTHINYAFGKVKGTFDGVRIDNEPRLREIVRLKTINPRLKVVLSIGGWGAGNFSEMAADPALRWKFALDCRRVVDEFGLDGIDIDWEYPTQNSAKISSSPEDTKNFTLLMRDIRKAIGRRSLLTAATVSTGEYIDFRSCLKYMDFVNVMAYDMSNPPYHHASLFSSNISPEMTCEKAVRKHLEAGVPKDKLVMGMPFYARGHRNQAVRDYLNFGYNDGSIVEKWSEESQVPYLEDKAGKMLVGFENERSLRAKCQYVIDQDLLGGMYWEYSEDNAPADKATLLYKMLMKP